MAGPSGAPQNSQQDDDRLGDRLIGGEALHRPGRSDTVSRRMKTTCLSLVALAVSAAAAVQAQEEVQADAPESWGTPLVISAADFRNNGNDREAFYFSPNGYLTGEGSTVVMIAPVYLPTGATVRTVSAHVYDNSTTCAYPEVTLWLNRVGAGTGTGMETMASASTSGAQSAMRTISDSSISYPVVDTLRYTYYAAVMMCSSAHELHSVVVYYEE
jgi:hypothetical protein